MKELNRKDLMEAVAEGVRQAFWQMMTNATDMPCADFYETVKEGVEAGVSRAMPFGDEILQAIESGMRQR